MWIYIAHCQKVSNALGTLVPAEKPSFQTVSEGLIVLLCTEVVRQGVPGHGVAQRMLVGLQWTSDVVAPRCCVADLRRCLPTTSVIGVQQSVRLRGTAEPCHADICV